VPITITPGAPACSTFLGLQSISEGRSAARLDGSTSLLRASRVLCRGASRDSRATPLQFGENVL